jgi:hypothetical protein
VDSKSQFHRGVRLRFEERTRHEPGILRKKRDDDEGPSRSRRHGAIP